MAQAGSLHEQVLATFRELGDKKNIAVALHQSGRLAEIEGNLAEAARQFAESLKLFEELQSPNAAIARRSLERVQRMLNRSA